MDHLNIRAGTRSRFTSIRSAVLLALLLAMCAGGPAASLAQDRRTLDTRVADLLARFPAASPGERDRAADEMLALGEEGIRALAGRLAPPETGGDTPVRFALNAMVVRASVFGNAGKRAVAESALAGALASASDPEVRTFLMAQLRLVGGDAAVAAAAPFLADPDLFEPATQLMLAIGNDASRKAVVSALRTATGASQVTLVKAAGELRAADADADIRKLSAAPGPDLRKAALAALARIASAASYDTLTSAASRARFGYEPSNATGALVEYARRLGEDGDLRTSERVCRLLIDKCRDTGRLGTAAAALAILAEFRGHDALPDLLKAADHPDKAFRNAALLQAERITGIAAMRQWVAKAQKVSPERRAEILSMLGRQGDRRSLPFIRSSLAAREPDVAFAAAEALARVAGPVANTDLLPLFKTWPGSEAARLASILLWTIDEAHLDPLVAMIDSLSPEAKAAAIGIVGAKGGKRFSSRVFALASYAEPAVTASALGALAGVAGPGDLEALLRLLESVAEPPMVENVQRAIVASAGAVQPAEERAGRLLAALKQSAHPERIIEILPQLGGAMALAAVIEQFERPEQGARQAAFRALTRWRGHEAAERLYLIRTDGDAEFSRGAFSAFVRQVSSSSLPAEQKLLQLRRVLPLAATVEERKVVLGAIGRVRTFQAFMVAASFIDAADLAGDAASAMMRIALPAAGSQDGLSGRIVRDGLNRVLQVLSGPEADYDKANIRNYLASMPEDDGFTPIFNGRDLAGWHGLVENPIARAKMTPQDLAAKQSEADTRMHENWSVRDGSIVFNGKGDNLCTVKEYGDFEMLVDWRITKGGDSGIYLRGTPQVQIWDTARTDVGAEVGSGGLYNNQKNPSKPLVVADNPVGEWNTLGITMTGEKVTVFLNGIKVVDDVTMENYWDRAQPIFPRGAIELQAHGTDLAFRDVYVREISDAESGLTEEERAEGFVPLFNGRNLDGWTGNVKGYKVEQGAMVFDPASGDRTNLFTAKEYGDFHLRFEFQLTPGANSGVGIRAPLEGDAAYLGMEIQVLDDTAQVYASLQPYQYHGSVYGVIAAKRGFLKPVGEWNSEEILVRGSRVRVTLNGTVIVDGDIAEASREGTLDGQPHPGLQRSSGRISWLSHDTVVRFRNVRVKELR